MEENRLPDSRRGERKLKLWLRDFGISRSDIQLVGALVAVILMLVAFVVKLFREKT
jgi:hypothetical protein